MWLTLAKVREEIIPKDGKHRLDGAKTRHQIMVDELYLIINQLMSLPDFVQTNNSSN